MKLGKVERYQGNPGYLVFEVDTEWKDYIIISTWDRTLNRFEKELELSEVEKLIEQLSAWVGQHKGEE